MRLSALSSLVGRRDAPGSGPSCAGSRPHEGDAAMLRPRILAPLCALAVTAALAIIIPITSASAATCTAPTWNAATAYNGGAQVSYDNHQYTAKWWSQGHRPTRIPARTASGATTAPAPG